MKFDHMEFVDKILEPFFLTNVEKRKVQINEYDKTVINSLNARGRPLKARSVKNIRSVIQQVDFKCKKCGEYFTSHGQLMIRSEIMPTASTYQAIPIYL